MRQTTASSNLYKDPETTYLPEQLVLYFAVSIIISFMAGFFLHVTMDFLFSSPSVDASFNNKDFIFRARAIADDLGNPERKGYSDDLMDKHDDQQICRELKLPLNTPIEDIKPQKIRDFVLEHEQAAK